MNSEFRLLHGPRKGTRLDQDAINEGLRSNYIIIEGTRNTSENGAFDVTKVG
jgi:hypothetical protein